jgi:cytochrome b6-f complex iron-sulfur subunit
MIPRNAGPTGAYIERSNLGCFIFGAIRMPDLNRRQFVTVASATVAAACAMCACGETVLAEEAPGGGSGGKAPTTGPAFAKTPVDIGPKSDYAKDGIVDKFAKSSRILVVTNAGKIYAPTATCSHKNCAVKLKDSVITCPCHGSKFSIEGTSTKGPAKASLYRYAVSVDDKGNVIVDRSKQFAEKDWDSEGASIKV